MTTRNTEGVLSGAVIDQFNNGNVGTAVGFARRFASLSANSTNAIELMMADRIQATALHYLGDQKVPAIISTERSHMMQSRHGSPRSSVPGSIYGCPRTISRRASFGSRDMRTRHCMWLRTTSRRRTASDSLCHSAASWVRRHVRSPSGPATSRPRHVMARCCSTIPNAIRSAFGNIWARCFLGLVTAARGDVASGLPGFERWARTGR